LAETGVKPCPQDVFFLYFGLAVSLAPVALGLEFDPLVFYAGIAVLALALLNLCQRGAFFTTTNHVFPIFTVKWFYRLYFFCTVLWVALVILKYFSLGYHTFDTGIYSQLLAGFARSNRFHSTFTNRSGLADHFCPNLMLLYPFFKLYPTCFWLIGFKLVAFLACPLLLLHLGKKVIGPDSRLIYLTPLLFLFHSYLANTMAFEFQPSSLALPFVLLAFVFALENKPILTLLTMLFLLGFKEHLPLVWVSIAVFLFTEKKQVFPALFLFVLGIAFGAILTYSAIPFFNFGEPSPHSYLIQPTALVWPKLGMLILAFTSVGFLPLLAPKSALFVLPAFGTAILSNVPEMQTFDYHYQDVPLVVLFVSVVFGLAAYKHQQSWLCRLTNRYQELFFAIGLVAICTCSTRFVTTFIFENIPSKDRLELLSETQRYAKRAPQDVDLWVVEPLTVLFLGHPQLRSLDRYKRSPSQAEQAGELPKTWPPHVVVFTDNADTSGLPLERYEEAQKGLEAGLLTGKYKLEEGFHRLRVYIH
jgi:uncharacterized membrane protein